MSATISIKRTMARGTDAALFLFQHTLVIIGLVLAIGFFPPFISDSHSTGTDEAASATSDQDIDVAGATEKSLSTSPATTTTLTPRMQGALEYVKRRYRVSPEAMRPVFEAAQIIGKERKIDPLLIVAVIGVESQFNPFAQSAMGAQGLMQIIPRFHMDKIPSGAKQAGLLDPIINIKVGAHILDEAIRRQGGLIAGLQFYSGTSDPTNDSYPNKVLAEKARLEQAARSGNGRKEKPALMSKDEQAVSPS